jgi:hypothetical protein
MIPTIRQRRHLVKTNPDISQAVLLDHRIWDTRYPFAYTLYTCGFLFDIKINDSYNEAESIRR